MVSNNRKNCPLCYRSNSVKIHTDCGTQTEHCFGADCNYYKNTNTELEIADINQTHIRYLNTNLLIEARSHKASVKFLQKYHCLESTSNIYYHPKDNRIVFNYKDLYVGRSLDKHIQPKWYVYTDSIHPFVVQTSKQTRSEQIILVEDCISACNASRIYDSIALLGTSLCESYFSELCKYKVIYIALDEDASSTALKLQQILEMVRYTKVILLEKDIKYLDLDELKELFK